MMLSVYFSNLLYLILQFMFIKSLIRLFSNSKNLSLRTILIVPFVIQIVVAVALIGWLSFYNGQKAVDDIATQLGGEITARIHQHLKSLTALPLMINKNNAGAIHLGLLDLDCIPTPPDPFLSSSTVNTCQKNVVRYFWNQVKAFNTVSYVGVGSENGKYIGAKMRDDQSIIIELANSKKDLQTWETNADAELLKPSGTKKNYEPRIRPWYQSAVAAKQPVWSDIYVYFVTKTLGISINQPVYDNQGNLLAVTSVDLSLLDMSNFLKRLKIGKTGKIFIMERSGTLIATSTTEKPFYRDPDNQHIERVQTINSRDPLTSATARLLAKKFGYFADINSRQQHQFFWEGKRQFLEVLPFQDEWGLDWLIVVVVPAADFMEDIHANTRVTLWLSFGALILAILIGIFTAQRIVKPIRQLNDASKAFAKGQWEQRVLIERKDELGELSQSFNTMALQLKASFTAIEVQNKVKDEFLANTSHELRTPLNGIIGLTESLIEGAAGKLPDKAIFDLSLLVSSSRRLSNLINDLLDFSQMKNQQIQLQCHPVGLREVAEIVLALNQPLLAQKNIQLVNAISAKLPPVNADENRIQQILHNLVDNGIKFTENGRVEISARVAELPKMGKGMEITISDSGIGIEKKNITRIFESFEQGDGSITRQYGGTGLGLAITKQLVELHGGEIRVESIIGIGSRFIFTLPISKAEQAEKLESSQERQTQVSSVSSKSIPQSIPQSSVKTTDLPKFDGNQVGMTNVQYDIFKILIVEDEAINRQILVNYLSLQHYEIMEAANGIEALEIMKTDFEPDMILLDVMMPKMTGLEVCRKFREQKSVNELPILMLTAKNSVSDMIEGLGAGANDYLGKPISKNALLARIKTHFQLYKVHLAYSRFVPREFIQLLGKKNVVDISLGDQIEKEMTILFSDMRGFTSLSEAMAPQENFDFLNAYLGQMEPIIYQHQGIIDKYIGDAIMALFPIHADDAVRGAIAMLNRLAKHNKLLNRAGFQPIKIGIGLHTGRLMLGAVGGQRRMDSTVISDAVNLASRIESMTKIYGATLLISGETYSRLKDASQYAIRIIDRVKVKGKSQAVTVYEVLDGEVSPIQEMKMKTIDDFEQGMTYYYQKQFKQAAHCFQQILEISVEDKAAQIYLKRCEHFQKWGVPDDWDGVEALESK
jgi:two-component system sensor histidine kinase ChiS